MESSLTTSAKKGRQENSEGVRGGAGKGISTPPSSKHRSKNPFPEEEEDEDVDVESDAGDEAERRERERFILEHREQLEKEPWFFCKIDRNGAEALLSMCKEDSFMVRHSSVEDHYALSLFDFKKQQVNHTLIKPLDYGKRYFQLQDSARLYPSVQQLISSAPELQGFRPLLNTTQVPAASPSSLRKSTDKEAAELSFQSLIKIDNVQEEARKYLDEPPSQHKHSVSILKANLKTLIHSHELAIQNFDKLLVKRSFDVKGEVKLSDEENTEYLSHTKQLNELSVLLNKLRLKGEDFKIVHKGQNKILKVTQDSTLLFCSVKRSTNPQDLAPQDMSQFAYFNVGVIEGKNGSVYEITSSNAIHYIDQVQKIMKDNKIGRGGICINWKNSKKSSFTTINPSDADELLDVINTHLKRFNQSTIKQIQLLKDIHKCKATQFDASVPEHEALLLRLWSTLMPDTPLSGMVSKQWKLIGFQGNNPATDFRGMGLLGLLNLIYFAENYTAEARKQIAADRDYPWATTGINITHMLISMLNLTKELIGSDWSDKSWHTPLLNLFYYADNDDTFDELYSQAFLLFDRMWVHMNAKYMDFPSVIQRLQSRMEELLRRKPLDVLQLTAWISQLYTTFE